MKQILIYILIFTGIMTTLPPVSANTGEDRKITIFSYFQGNGETGVYLKTSDDGFNFVHINDGEPVFDPPASFPADQQLTRDPSIIHHEGMFHMVWTTNWEGKFFGYAQSSDLKEWSEPQLVRPFPEDLPDDQQPGNVWAPEIHYDPVNDDFFVVFSSTIPHRLEQDTLGMDAHGNNHRMYITRTEDGEHFSDAEMFYNPGFSSIDGQLYYEEYGSSDTRDDRWIMSFKHERMPEHGGKNIRLVFMDPETGEFSDYSEPIVGPGSGLNEHWAEGSTLIKDDDGWWNLYWDTYIVGYYGLARSPDLKEWSDETQRLNIDVAHPRHGSFLPVSASEVAWPATE